MAPRRPCCLLLLVLGSYAVALVTEQLDWGDVWALNSSAQEVADAFQRAYGIWPKGLSLNFQSRMESPYPLPTTEFSRFCFKYLGDIVYESLVDVNEYNLTVTQSVLFNSASTAATQSLDLTGSWEEVASLRLLGNDFVKFSSDILVDGIFDSGLEFSLYTDYEKSKMRKIKTYTSRIIVDVPPESSITVDMVAIMKTRTMNFKAPVNVKGDFGANYDRSATAFLLMKFGLTSEPGDCHLWKGKYVCFLPADKVLPTTVGSWRGRVKGVMAVDVKLKLHPAQPVTAAT